MSAPRSTSEKIMDIALGVLVVGFVLTLLALLLALTISVWQQLL